MRRHRSHLRRTVRSRCDAMIGGGRWCGEGAPSRRRRTFEDRARRLVASQALVVSRRSVRFANDQGKRAASSSVRWRECSRWCSRPPFIRTRDHPGHGSCDVRGRGPADGTHDHVDHHLQRRRDADRHLHELQLVPDHTEADDANRPIDVGMIPGGATAPADGPRTTGGPRDEDQAVLRRGPSRPAPHRIRAL